MINFLKLLLPPITIKLYHKLKLKIYNKKDKKEETIEQRIRSRMKYNSEGNQDVNIYWDEEFAQILDTWGKDNTWLEIQLLLSNCSGKTLDIACGSGPVMEICKDFKNIELHGCDISDLLIAKAHEKRNIMKERLRVMDATQMNYKDDEFNFSYSIGSLEHFTEEGIAKFIAEAHRVTKYGSFHLVPTNYYGRDEGWITPLQSYYNNSINWWLTHFKKKFDKVIAVKSKHEDPVRSYSHWFLCYKAQPVY